MSSFFPSAFDFVSGRREELDSERHQSRLHSHLQLRVGGELEAVPVHPVDDGPEDLLDPGAAQQLPAHPAERGHHSAPRALRLPPGHSERVPGRDRIHRHTARPGRGVQVRSVLPHQVLCR